MSERAERRIALVAEGPTDYVIIEAALKAILLEPFILTLLQPEATRPAFGSGWCGVLKWCHDTGMRHAGLLEEDPLLPGFDMLIIHLDLDVAAAQYQDCGPRIDGLAKQHGWQTLPCALPCPPPDGSAVALRAVLQSWLGRATPGRRTVICLPAQSSGTWLAFARLPAAHPLLARGECDSGIEMGLERLPLQDRIHKRRAEYHAAAPDITKCWAYVKQQCRQAEQFEQDVQAAC